MYTHICIQKYFKLLITVITKKLNKKERIFLIKMVVHEAL